MISEVACCDIGVAMLSFNSPKVVIPCAKKLLETLPHGVKVLFVDDNSYAANVKLLLGICEKFNEEHNGNFARIWRNVCNRGAAACRNIAWEYFVTKRCKYAATIDGDIIVKPGWLEELYSLMEDNSTCGIATFKYCNEHGGHFPYVDGKVAETASMLWLTRLSMLDYILGPDVVWGMDERMRNFSHDSEFCQRMKRHSNYRVYVSDKDLLSEAERGHSTKDSSKTFALTSRHQRAIDSQIWAELEAARGWFEGKELV